GGLLESDDRQKLHSKLESLKLPVVKRGEEGSDSTIFVYEIDENGNWIHWKTRVKEWFYPTDHTPEFNTIIVPTVDSVRCEFLIDLIAKQRLSVLLIGESGSAKTVTIQQYIEKQDKTKVKDKFICFSSATTPGLFQRAIVDSVEKRMSNS